MLDDSTMDTKKELSAVTFGSVTILVERPSPEEIKKNILNGQIALARAKKAFMTKGVKLKVREGTPLYQATPNNPRFLLRNIDGKIDQGIFEDGQFKVTGTQTDL